MKKVRMEINFKTHDGLCPYFIYKNIKFFIQDCNEHGKYTYSLYLRQLKEKIEIFENKKDAIEWINKIKGIRFVCSYGDLRLYTNILSHYVIKDNKIIIRPTERPLSGSFDNYIDCLNFAKKHVMDYINSQEPEQLQIMI